MTEYEQLSEAVWRVYNTCMINPDKETNRVSLALFVEFQLLLRRTKITNSTDFTQRIGERLEILLEINEEMKEELIKHLPSWCHTNLTDLNSVVMGVPNDTGSDLDFTIAVESKKEQETIHEVLERIGYKLVHIWDDNIPNDDIKWMDYVKYYKGVEIEVKVRWKKVVDSVMIAHRNIKNNLTKSQKMKVSYIKSILTTGDKKTYKTFKYIIYGAMFQGHHKTIIFRH